MPPTSMAIRSKSRAVTAVSMENALSRARAIAASIGSASSPPPAAAGFVTVTPFTGAFRTVRVFGFEVPDLSAADPVPGADLAVAARNRGLLLGGAAAWRSKGHGSETAVEAEGTRARHQTPEFRDLLPDDEAAATEIPGLALPAGFRRIGLDTDHDILVGLAPTQQRCRRSLADCSISPVPMPINSPDTSSAWIA